MSKVGAIVLSRFSSKRLPGKALLEIDGKKVLEYIIERLRMVLDDDQIVIATSKELADDKIEEFCNEQGVQCYRGDLDNVSRRFYNAAQSCGFDYAIRINGDNIFLDINILQEMITIAKNGDYKFLSNVKGRTFPKGMSIEIVRLKYYRELLHKIEESDYFKEHVMVYLYSEVPQNEHFYYMNNFLPEAGGIQFALDTQEDFENIQRIILNFKEDHIKYNLREIYTLWKEQINDF